MAIAKAEGICEHTMELPYDCTGINLNKGIM